MPPVVCSVCAQRADVAGLAGQDGRCPACGTILPGATTAPDSQATQPPANEAAGQETVPPAGDPGSTTGYSAGGQPVDDRAPPGYEVLEELGRGGMGVVYRARQVALKRDVALKMILAGAHASAEALARFRREAEALARLQHPGIVAVHEIGEHEGRPFFSLEYCPGGSLEKKLAGQPLPPREAAALVQRLAEAIHAAHQAQVVHRDLKPANVLLSTDSWGRKEASGGRKPPESACDHSLATPSGGLRPPLAGSHSLATPSGGLRPPLAGEVPKITDFGIARTLDEAGQTHTGAVMGTPSYMAPEQAEGKKEVGPPADIWALGAILYECLTGRPPFRAPTMLDAIMQVVNDEPVPPRQHNAAVPRDLQTICLKCLQKDPARRYASAAALADDLRRFLAGEPIVARPVGALERAGKWARRNPVVAGLSAAVLLVLLAGAVVVAAFVGRDQRQSEALDREKRQADASATRAEEIARREKQKEEAARRARDKEEKALVEELLRPIGQSSGLLTPAEQAALLRLGGLRDDRLRIRFLETALGEPATARRVGQRAAWVAQAAVGLNRDVRREAGRLLARRLGDAGVPPEVALACVWLGLSLNLQDRDWARRSADVLVAAAEKPTPSASLPALAEDLVTIGPLLDGPVRTARATRMANILVTALAHPPGKGETSAAALVRALDAVGALLGPAGSPTRADRTAGALLSAMIATKDMLALARLAQAFGTINAHLDDARAEARGRRAADLVVLAVLLTTDTARLDWFAWALPPLDRWLSPAGAAQVADALVAALNGARNHGTLLRLTVAIARANDRARDGQAARAGKTADALLAAILAHKTIVEPFHLVRAFRAIAGQLDQPGAARVADALVAARAKTRASGVLSALLQCRAALCPRLDSTAAERTADDIIATLVRIGARPPHRIRSLLHDLAAASRHLSADWADRAADTILAALRNTTHPDLLSSQARGIAVLAPRLSPAGAVRTADALLAAVARARGPAALAALAHGLTAVNTRLADSAATARASRMTDALVAALANPGKSAGLVALRDGFRTIAPHLDRATALRAADALAAVLEKTRKDHTFERAALAEALAAVSPRLGPGEAAVRAERAAQRLVISLQNPDPLFESDAPELAAALAAIAPWLDSAGSARVAEALVVGLNRTRQATPLAGLAQGLGAVNAPLAEDQAGKRLSRPLDVLVVAVAGYRGEDEAALATLVRGLGALGRRFDGAGADRAAGAIVTLMSSRNTETDDLADVGEVLAAIAARWGSAGALRLLRHPLAAGPAQGALLRWLGRPTRRSFRCTWHFLDWAEGNGVDLLAAAR